MATVDELYPPIERECDEYRRALEALDDESWLEDDPADSQHLAAAKQQARAALAKYRND